MFVIFSQAKNIFNRASGGGLNTWDHPHLLFRLSVIVFDSFWGRGLGYGEVPSPRLLNLQYLSV